MSEASGVRKAVADLIGKESGPVPALDDIDPYMIRHWTEAAQDANPLYHDLDYARRRGHPERVMPPTMLSVLGLEPLWSPTPRPEQPHLALLARLAEAGFPGRATIALAQKFRRPVHVGERLTYTARVVDVSAAPVATSFGDGHLVRVLFTFRDGGGEVVGSEERTILAGRRQQGEG